MMSLIPFLIIIGGILNGVYFNKDADAPRETEAKAPIETTIESKPPEIKIEPEVVEVKEEKPPEEPPQEEVKTEEPPTEEAKTEVRA